MRHLLLASLTCAAVVAAPVFAADEPAKDHPKHEAAAKEGKAVNKLDPLTGKEVVADAGTLDLTYKKDTVTVGFSSKESLEKAKAADDKLKELIAKAAKHHQLIKDGGLVEPAGKHDKDKKDH